MSESPIDPEVRSMIAACCAASRAVSVITQDLPGPCQGRFVSIQGDTVTIEIVSAAPGATLSPRSIGCMTFHHDDRSRVFLAQLASDLPTGPGEHQLVFDLPASIAAADVRRAIRVPVRADSGLAVEVVVHGRSYAPRVQNVSTGGVLLKFAPEADPELAVDAKFSVRLTLAARAVTLTGMVRRRKGQEYAVFFGEIFEGRQPATRDLEEIVGLLEKSWLAARRTGSP